MDSQDIVVICTNDVNNELCFLSFPRPDESLRLLIQFGNCRAVYAPPTTNLESPVLKTYECLSLISYGLRGLGVVASAMHPRRLATNGSEGRVVPHREEEKLEGDK
jgi:hypothetical protein